MFETVKSVEMNCAEEVGVVAGGGHEVGHLPSYLILIATFPGAARVLADGGDRMGRTQQSQHDERTSAPALLYGQHRTLMEHAG